MLFIQKSARILVLFLAIFLFSNKSILAEDIIVYKDDFPDYSYVDSYYTSTQFSPPIPANHWVKIEANWSNIWIDDVSPDYVRFMVNGGGGETLEEHGSVERGYHYVLFVEAGELYDYSIDMSCVGSEHCQPDYIRITDYGLSPPPSPTPESTSEPSPEPTATPYYPTWDYPEESSEPVSQYNAEDSLVVGSNYLGQVNMGTCVNIQYGQTGMIQNFYIDHSFDISGIRFNIQAVTGTALNVSLAYLGLDGNGQNDVGEFRFYRSYEYPDTYPIETEEEISSYSTIGGVYQEAGLNKPYVDVGTGWLANAPVGWYRLWIENFGIYCGLTVIDAPDWCLDIPEDYSMYPLEDCLATQQNGQGCRDMWLGLCNQFNGNYINYYSFMVGDGNYQGSYTYYPVYGTGEAVNSVCNVGSYFKDIKPTGLIPVAWWNIKKWFWVTFSPACMFNFTQVNSIKALIQTKAPFAYVMAFFNSNSSSITDNSSLSLSLPIGGTTYNWTSPSQLNSVFVAIKAILSVLIYLGFGVYIWHLSDRIITK
jgi:hypothetical protein